MHGVFPTMLNNKATLLGSLTREEIIIVGITYIILARLHVSSLVSLCVLGVVLTIMHLLKRTFHRGFFSHLFDPKELNWRQKL